MKYFDEALRDGRSMEQVIWDEKQREDWVRGMTSYRVVRCGAEHCVTANSLGARLRAFGLRPPH